MPTHSRLQKEGRRVSLGLDPDRSPQDSLPTEPWIGRLRMVVVPVVAVIAIAAVIYLLQDKPRPLVSSDGLGPEPIAAASGAFQQVQLPSSGEAAAGTLAPRIGNPAPSFALNDLDGRVVRLSDFRGQAVFLNFFASWCPPCRAEMPDILATYEENKTKGAMVLAVDLQEDAQIVRNYASNVGLTFPIVLDRNAQVAARYRINGIPTSFFIDKDGVIKDMQIGAMSKSIMQTRLNKAMLE